MTPLEKDIASAKRKMIGAATDLLRRADANDKYTNRMWDRVNIVAAVIELPGDMPLRVFCFPNVWNLKA